MKHQKDIDRALDKVGEKVDEVAKEGGVWCLQGKQNGFPFIRWNLPDFVEAINIGFDVSFIKSSICLLFCLKKLHLLGKCITLV